MSNELLRNAGLCHESWSLTFFGWTVLAEAVAGKYNLLCSVAWHDHEQIDSLRHVCTLPSLAAEVRCRHHRRLRHTACTPCDRPRIAVKLGFGQLSVIGAMPPLQEMHKSNLGAQKSFCSKDYCAEVQILQMLRSAKTAGCLCLHLS